MKEIIGAIGLIVIAIGITYLVSAGIAWIFIWAFELQYSPWVIALPVWFTWVVIDKIRPKRKKTTEELWNEWK